MEFSNNELLDRGLLGRKMFEYLLVISVTCNLLVMIRAYLDKDMTLASICFVLMLFALFGFFATRSIMAAHFQLIPYVVGFTYASFTHLASYPLVLIYPVVIGFSVLFFRNTFTKVFYLCICLLGCTVTLVNEVKFMNIDEGSHYIANNIIICYGLIFGLFLLHQMYFIVLERYRNTIQQKNQQLQKIFDVSNSGIVYRDLMTNEITSCNKRFLEICGAPNLEDVNRLNPKHLMPKYRDMDDDKFQAIWSKEFFGGDTQYKDVDWENLKGEKMKIRMTSTLDDSNDEGLSSITFFVDITEEYGAKKELQEKNVQLQNIFEASSDGIIYRECTTKEIVFCNKRALELFGARSFEEVRKINPTHFVKDYNQSKKKIDEFHKVCTGVYRAGQMNQMVVDFENLKGEKYKMRITSGLNESDDGKKMVVTFLTDMTQEIKAKKQLKEKNKELQKYIESNIQLEQFAHIASHDLMAPANTVKTFSNLLKDRLYDDLGDQEKVFCDIVHGNSVEMYRLVEDLLEYSKVNSQKINRSKFDSKILVQEVISMLQLAIDEKSITVEIADNLPTIIADRVKVKRVFQNLLSNGVKFSKDNNKSRIWVEFQEKVGLWVFTVGDNGIGMPKTKVDIFEPYTRLNLKENYSGTGMGLSFCKKIIEQHGGNIRFTSVYGEGTVFTFTIPKRKEKRLENEKVKENSIGR